jgi:putative membrane protein
VDAEDSARMRDLLASNRTLLAWIRTALSFAGLGFAVDKFGRTPGLVHLAGYLGIIMTLVGLLFTIIGFAQHRTVLTEEKPPPGAPVPTRWPAVVAAAACALACAFLAAYLAVSMT